MKQQIKQMYSQITMPEDMQARVKRAMAQKKPAHHLAGNRLVTGAAILVLIVSLSPVVMAAVGNWVIKYFWPDSDITIYETLDENGSTIRVTGVATEAEGFARMINGRLYFLGNGEKIDITDILIPERPYCYTYVDEYNLKHFMFVGYSDTIDNFGIYEFIKEKGEDSAGWTQWVTGTGRNFLNPETGTRYPWVDIVWEIIDVPWPMPE